jgi:hypothetical protein
MGSGTRVAVACVIGSVISLGWLMLTLRDHTILAPASLVVLVLTGRRAAHLNRSHSRLVIGGASVLLTWTVLATAPAFFSSTYDSKLSSNVSNALLVAFLSGAVAATVVTFSALLTPR